MVRIPRLSLPEPTGGTNITTSVAKAGSKVADYMLKQEQDAAVLDHTKLDSDLRLGLTLKSQELKQSPEIQANPELYGQELEKYGQDFIDSNTEELSFYSKTRNKEVLQNTLNKAVLTKGNAYQIKQNSVNQINNLNSIATNSALQAFHDPSSSFGAKNALINQIQILQNNGVLRVEQGQKILEKATNSIDRASIQGYLDEGDIDKAEAYLNNNEVQKSLGAAQYASFKGKIDHARSQRDKGVIKALNAQAQITAIGLALNTNTPLDPTDPDTRKALNTYYDQSEYMSSDGTSRNLAQGLSSLDPEASKNLLTQVQKTAYIPKTAVNTLNSFILNGNTQQQTYALDTIARINENDKYGAATKYLDKKTQVISASANRDISAGMPLSRALKLAEEKMNINKDVAERRQKTLNSIHSNKEVNFEQNMKKSIETATGIDGERWYWPDSSFDDRTTSIQRDKALLDYQTLFDDYYKTTGDQDLATTLANKDFSRQYTITQVSGEKRLMKYAPELYYSVPELNREQNTKWQRKQLQEDVSLAVGTKVKNENIILIPDEQTAREANSKEGQPSYSILIRNEEGDYKEIRQNGQLQRFRFDMTEAKERTEDYLSRARHNELKNSKMWEKFFKSPFSFPGHINIPPGKKGTYEKQTTSPFKEKLDNFFNELPSKSVLRPGEAKDAAD